MTAQFTAPRPGSLYAPRGIVPVTLTLYAAETGEVLASFHNERAMVNPDARLIGGIAIPYNVIGTPSIGRAKFRPGSLSPPPQASNVKLLIAHDRDRSVGYLAECEDHPTAMLAAYKVAEGPAGDDAIQGIQDRTRDGLSVGVEVYEWDRNGDVIDVIRAVWKETSLLSIPAYDGARAAVFAAANHNERNIIMERLANMLHLEATAPQPDPPTPQPDPPTPQPDPAPALMLASAQLDVIAGQLAQRLGLPALRELPAPPPGAVPGARPSNSGPLDLAAACQAVAQWHRSGSQNVIELYAALSDVVPADDTGEGLIRPQWLGQVWTASQARRPYVDALGKPKKLTGLRAYGWRWLLRPEVDDYAGAKADIPSNPVSTEPVTAPAHRTAGGWDVDRVYVDLGEPGMIQALFEAATEDYRLKSNAYVGAQLLAAAIADGPAAIDAADFAAALVAIGAASYGVGGQLGFMAIASDVFAAIAALTQDDVPFWFSNGGATINVATGEGTVQSFKWWVDPTLDDGQYVAGDSRAATYFEEGDVPIRVEAVNIPKGGVDLGVFGYNAVIVNDPRLLLTGTIG